ncbi:C1 family peptidase, partial [Collinsella stercoris]|uniref:C1 family peptidase n=1 Tax=Collinsella stercoris TaxID=147206 RepID=UPI0026F3727F
MRHGRSLRTKDTAEGDNPTSWAISLSVTLAAIFPPVKKTDVGTCRRPLQYCRTYTTWSTVLPLNGRSHAPHGRQPTRAALNTFRHKLISQYKLENFELSQAHTFFWDKYEKSN